MKNVIAIVGMCGSGKSVASDILENLYYKKIKYNRLAVRDIRSLSNEEAMKRDIVEIENIAKVGPIAYEDYYIDNNHDLETYKNRLMDIIDEIRKKDE